MWEKQGVIFRPNPKYYWMKTHAMLPIAENINKDIFRIYFSGRDDNNRSLIGFFHFDITDPFNIFDISSQNT